MLISNLRHHYASQKACIFCFSYYWVCWVWPSKLRIRSNIAKKCDILAFSGECWQQNNRLMKLLWKISSQLEEESPNLSRFHNFKVSVFSFSSRIINLCLVICSKNSITKLSFDYLELFFLSWQWSLNCPIDERYSGWQDLDLGFGRTSPRSFPCRRSFRLTCSNHWRKHCSFNVWSWQRCF